MQFTRSQYWLLAVLSGLLLAISWPMRGFAFASLFAFIPLFLIEDSIRNDAKAAKGSRVFGFAMLAFVIWNLLTTYWIYNAHPAGIIAALLVNGSLMSLAFLAYHKIRNQFINKSGGQLLLIFPWLAFEYLHLDWDLTWSWMNLGNVFGPWQKWIQWYEFTGAFGGTVWVLMINALLYHTLIAFLRSERIQGIRLSILSLLVFIIPSAISIYIYRNYQEKSDPVEVVVVQPNIDPWEEKYGGMPYKQQLSLMLDLAREEMDENTEYVVFPESALQESIWENELEGSYSIDSLTAFLDDWPKSALIMGAMTYRRYLPGEEHRKSARYWEHRDIWYDAGNTMIYMQKDRVPEYYHKSKLVAGVENMPFAQYLKFIEGWAIQLGGIRGTLLKDEVRKVFYSRHDSLGTSAAICFESVYGEFYSRFVRNGADLMFIITNDGWWGDTPGYKQHLMFAPIRAIETRRSIARSANTGVSAFVNQRGDILERTDYWVADVMKTQLNANDRITFYVRYGDYIARIGTLVTAMLLLISLTRAVLRRRGADPKSN